MTKPEISNEIILTASVITVILLILVAVFVRKEKSLLIDAVDFELDADDNSEDAEEVSGI